MKLTNVIIAYLMDGPKTFPQLIHFCSPFIDPAQAIRLNRHKEPNGSEQEIAQGRERRVRETLRGIFDAGDVEWADGLYRLTEGTIERIRKSPPARPCNRVGAKAADLLSTLTSLWIQGRIDLKVVIKEE